MIDKLNEEIAQVNSNIDVLPVKTKTNIVKYNEYIDECLAKYNDLLKQAEEEINKRNDATVAKYKDLTYVNENTELNYSAFVLSDTRSTSSEKMNLDYQFFKLNNSTVNDLSEVNQILTNILTSFHEAGVEIIEKDFVFSEDVKLYMHEIFTHENNIQDVFNEVFRKNSDIINQIVLNFKYLYYKNIKKLDQYFKTRYSEFDYHSFIKKHRDKIYQNEKNKHESVKYLYDIFTNQEQVLADFMDEKKTEEIMKSLLNDIDAPRNYEILINLSHSLQEYKGYKTFEYIITDFKELFTHKAEYKDLFNNKLKEISKVEGTIISLTKKINKTGLFKLKEGKLADSKVERTKQFNDLTNLYKELDELKFKETINKYVNNDTNYYDVLKLTSYNFNYFIKLLEDRGLEVNVENIDKEMYKLYKYLYDNDINVINNILLSDEKEVIKIISEMYTLNGVLLNEGKLEDEVLDKLIETVNKLLICFDIKLLKANLEDFKFILDVREALK